MLIRIAKYFNQLGFLFLFLIISTIYYGRTITFSGLIGYGYYYYWWISESPIDKFNFKQTPHVLIF